MCLSLDWSFLFNICKHHYSKYKIRVHFPLAISIRLATVWYILLRALESHFCLIFYLMDVLVAVDATRRRLRSHFVALIIRIWYMLPIFQRPFLSEIIHMRTLNNNKHAFSYLNLSRWFENDFLFPCAPTITLVEEDVPRPVEL